MLYGKKYHAYTHSERKNSECMKELKKFVSVPNHPGTLSLKIQISVSILSSNKTETFTRLVNVCSNDRYD